MDVDLTIDDPKCYLRPFTVKLPFHLIRDSDAREPVCAENEKVRIQVVKCLKWPTPVKYNYSRAD